MAYSFSIKDIVIGVIMLAALAAVVVFSMQKNAARPLPATLLLQVPFTTQELNGNWDNNKDCEEASITMANAYLTGSTEDKLPARAAQESIDALKAWEEAHIGYNADTGAAETTAIAEQAFNLKVRQISDYTEQDLKDALAAHHPVLLPINARKLGNPKYQDAGPFYHMFVVRGYNDQGFIVNDPGTESGMHNVYSFSVLKEAAADWNNSTKMMEPNKKIALVLSR